MLSMTLATSEYKVLEALIARIADGDKDALGELYGRTHAAVFGFAMSMASSPADAEDILPALKQRIMSVSQAKLAATQG